MRIRQALTQAVETLSTSDIEEAPLEADILLRHILDLSPTELHIRLDQDLSPKQIQQFNALIRRRASHEPIAYITEHREFFGLDFYVNPDTLIPRPETEILVEQAIAIASKMASPKIVDVGTGCGAIAIALAKHLPQAELYAVDISPEALKVANSNLDRHGVSRQVRLIQGDLLHPIEGPIDIIAANLPYITDDEMTRLHRQILHFEPQQALRAGSDGLTYIDRLLKQAATKMRPNGHLLLEIGQYQAKAVIDLSQKCSPKAKVTIFPDLAGSDRVVHIKT